MNNNIVMFVTVLYICIIMAGRPKHYEDSELIERAIEVFWRKGYAAASAKDLLHAMDIGQGSFYRSFPGGKLELYRKSLVYFFEKSSKEFNNKLNQSQDPKQFIRDFFLEIADRSNLQIENGCYLGNAIVEQSNLDLETKKIAIDLLEKLKTNFEKALVKAKKMGKLDKTKSPKIQSENLLNLWNGINVTHRMATKKSKIKAIIESSLQVID